MLVDLTSPSQDGPGIHVAACGFPSISSNQVVAGSIVSLLWLVQVNLAALSQDGPGTHVAACGFPSISSNQVVAGETGKLGIDPTTITMVTTLGIDPTTVTI